MYCVFFAYPYSELKAKESGLKLRFACISEDNLSLVQGAACVGSCCVCSACMAKLYKLAKYVDAIAWSRLKTKASGSNLQVLVVSCMILKAVCNLR